MVKRSIVPAFHCVVFSLSRRKKYQFLAFEKAERAYAPPDRVSFRPTGAVVSISHQIAALRSSDLGQMQLLSRAIDAVPWQYSGGLSGQVRRKSSPRTKIIYPDSYFFTGFLRFQNRSARGFTECCIRSFDKSLYREDIWSTPERVMNNFKMGTDADDRLPMHRFLSSGSW